MRTNTNDNLSNSVCASPQPSFKKILGHYNTTHQQKNNFLLYNDQYRSQIKPQQYYSARGDLNKNYEGKIKIEMIEGLRDTYDGVDFKRIKGVNSIHNIDDNKKNQRMFYSPPNQSDKNGIKIVQIQQKNKKYMLTNNKFNHQQKCKFKVSEEIKKLRQDRKKRLLVQQKQSQLYNSVNLLNKVQTPAIGLKVNQQKHENNKLIQSYKKKKNGDQISHWIKNQKKSSDELTDKIQKKQFDFNKYKNKQHIAFITQQSDKQQKSNKYDYYKYSTSTKTLPTQSTLSSYSKKILQAKSNTKIQKIKYIEINNFILGKSIGQGKFGTVYQAFHKPTGWLYAIKKVQKSIIKSHLMIDQFILQLKLQTYLYHENILSLYTHFDDKDSIYLVLQYMQDGTLFTQLKRSKILPQTQVSIKIKQIVSAIKYLHDNQIAHRDIKPQNIVLSHGVCKLCDFGWATICSDRRKTYCGTFDYAPPQILQGIQYDYTVDLWCIGVLTYELLVGKAPFYHISRKQTMKKILNVEKTVLVYPHSISKNAINFIDSLIKKNPKQRLSSQVLLTHPFLKVGEKGV